jgi:hypothetical protein
VSDSAVAEDFGHTTTDQIEKTYGRVAKVRVRVEGSTMRLLCDKSIPLAKLLTDLSRWFSSA